MSEDYHLQNFVDSELAHRADRARNKELRQEQEDTGPDDQYDSDQGSTDGEGRAHELLHLSLLPLEKCRPIVTPAGERDARICIGPRARKSPCSAYG